jgi:predicted DNA-binding transcriptional regulator YafY
MSKRADAGKTAMRWMALLDLLGLRGRTVREIVELLADQGFHVTKRTVERDLVSLSVRFPLVDRQDDGGRNPARRWSLDASKRKLIPGLRRYEALTFDFLEQYAPTVLPRVVRSELAPFFESAIDELRQDSDSRLSQWRKKVYVSELGFEPEYPEPPDAAIEVVFNALYDDLQFEAHYTPRGKVGKRYRLHPAGLFYRGRVGYLIAYRDGMPNHAIYALHRFQDARIIDQRAEIPATVSVRKVAEDYFITRKGEQINLKMRIFEPGVIHHLSEATIGTHQRITQRGDHAELDATVADTEELRNWLRGFAGMVEVVEPASLRAKLKRDAESMLRRYQG